MLKGKNTKWKKNATYKYLMLMRECLQYSSVLFPNTEYNKSVHNRSNTVLKMTYGFLTFLFVYH